MYKQISAKCIKIVLQKAPTELSEHLSEPQHYICVFLIFNCVSHCVVVVVLYLFLGQVLFLTSAQLQQDLVGLKNRHTGIQLNINYKKQQRSRATDKM